MLAGLLDPMRIRQYFNAITVTRELAGGMRDDITFVRALRRALLPLPFAPRGRVDREPFPPLRSRPIRELAGRRIAILATGGSGALASVVGVARALEESRLRPVAISLCSGSALFGFPIAAGRPADEVASFTLGLGPAELIDVNWSGLLAFAPTLGRGFTGFMHGERVEAAYRAWLGDMTLGDMPIPAYAPVWNVEHNELVYIGPRTHPDLSVARAVRMAVALPLFIEAVPYNDEHYYDGGTADILPIHPLLDIEDPPDTVLLVNGFYAPDFSGDDVTGWVERPASILQAASQVRSVQHLQLARENLARLRREVPDVMTIAPVPYETVRGVGLYRQFIDNTRWADFMRAGRRAALDTLEDGAARAERSGHKHAHRSKKGRRHVGAADQRVVSLEGRRAARRTR